MWLWRGMCVKSMHRQKYDNFDTHSARYEVGLSSDVYLQIHIHCCSSMKDAFS